eukprot:jgi/Botrbrau1/13787/Bobra.0056s0038.2
MCSKAAAGLEFTWTGALEDKLPTQRPQTFSRARRKVRCQSAAIPVAQSNPDGDGPRKLRPIFQVARIAGLDVQSSFDPTGLGIESVDQEYEFSQSQSLVFAELEREMHRASRVYARMALADAIITAYNAYHGKLRVNGIADAFNYFTIAAFIYFGSFEFRAIYLTAGQDLHHLMRGLWQLVNVFQEIALLGVAVAFIQVATAAAVWPYTNWAIGVLAVFASVVRLAMFKKPQLFIAFLSFPRHFFDRLWMLPQSIMSFAVLALRLTEHILFRDPPNARPQLARPATPPGADVPIIPEEYEFTTKQERVVRAVVKSLQLVTLARLLQASAESLNLGIEIGRGAYVGAISVALHILEIIMSASLFLNCSKGLDLVHTTHGSDITNLMDGLGMKGGLGRLFRRLAHTLSIFLMAKLLIFVTPFVGALLTQWGIYVSDSMLLGATKVWQHMGIMFT